MANPRTASHSRVPTLLDALGGLSDDDAVALLGETYPGRKIWVAYGIWYAAGPCDCGCGGPRTLHAPNAAGLVVQLDKQARGAGGE